MYSPFPYARPVNVVDAAVIGPGGRISPCMCSSCVLLALYTYTCTSTRVEWQAAVVQPLHMHYHPRNTSGQSCVNTCLALASPLGPRPLHPSRYIRDWTTPPYPYAVCTAGAGGDGAAGEIGCAAMCVAAGLPWRCAPMAPTKQSCLRKRGCIYPWLKKRTAAEMVAMVYGCSRMKEPPKMMCCMSVCVPA